MFVVRSLLSLPFATCGTMMLGACAASPTVLGAAAFPAINLLTQRWKFRTRKPIGSPRSRKNKYYVRVPTPRIPEEMSELSWRYSHYRTEAKSLSHHFFQWKLEHYPQETFKRVADVNVEAPHLVVDPDFERILGENELENAKIAVAREERRRQELAMRENERLEVLTEFEDRRAEKIEVREEQVRKKKEIVAGMVTPETLADRLAKAFDNPVDFNFCINTRGKRVYGRPDPLNRVNMVYTIKDDKEAKEDNLAASSEQTVSV